MLFFMQFLVMFQAYKLFKLMVIKQYYYLAIFYLFYRLYFCQDNL
jgi:hypothetical protein